VPEAFSLGPLVIPTLRVGTLLLLALAAWFAARAARSSGLAAGWVAGTAEWAVVAGLLGARLVFAAQNWPGYQNAPWTVLFLWQPGFSVAAGFVAGGIFLLWRVLTRPAAQQPAYARVLGSGFLLAALLLVVLNAASRADFGAPGLRVGDTVPNFRLVDLSGEPVELLDYRGQAVVLNFWATWCGPCRREMPMLDAMNAAYAGRGAVIIGLDVGENAAAVERFIAETGVSYPIWLDGPRGADYDRSVELHQRFGGLGLPTTLFIDAAGVLRSVYTGELSGGLVQSRLAGLLPD
jgi:thiol-disulfide isomerase/thioredoxin